MFHTMIGKGKIFGNPAVKNHLKVIEKKGGGVFFTPHNTFRVKNTINIKYLMFQAMLSGPGQFAENETNEVILSIPLSLN